MSEKEKTDAASPSSKGEGDASDEDTQAILSRRSFLIETTLVNAGLGVGLGACRPQNRPHVCLKVASPREDTTSPTSDTIAPPKDAGPKPRVCLRIIRHRPKICLSVIRRPAKAIPRRHVVTEQPKETPKEKEEEP